MPTITIKHRISGAVLFTHEVTGEQQSSGLAMRATLEAACKDRADLRGADLSGADLGGKKLIGFRPVLQIGPIGSREDYLLAFITDAGVIVSAGCFEGSRDKFAAAVEKTHGTSAHGDEYRAALVLIDAHAKAWTPAVKPEKKAA
jgi:uncharacterized protein YjbI with pentapeptide repeats